MTSKINICKNLILLFVFSLAMANTSFAQEKIGYFSSSKLVGLVPEAKDIQAQIETISKEKQAIGTALENELKSKIAQFEKEQATMPEIIKESRVKEIKDLEAKTKEYYAAARKEIEEKRQELLKPVFDKVNAAIKAVAQKNKFTAIIDLDTGGQFLLYIDESKNILELMKKELGIKE